jgi:hypothetical protein
MARIARLINCPPPVPEYPVANGRYRWDFAWVEAVLRPNSAAFSTSVVEKAAKFGA